MCLLVYLAIESKDDIHRKEISVNRSCIAGMLIFIIKAGMGLLKPGASTVCDILLSVVPGCALLLTAKITRQAIGYGDGILLLVCGIGLGGRAAVTLFLTGLLFMCPISLILLLTRRANRRDELPFAPFLLAAFLCWLIS